MKNYETPILEVVEVVIEDICASSGNELGGFAGDHNADRTW